MRFAFAETDQDDATPLVGLTADTLPDWLASQPESVSAWAETNAFKAKPGSVLRVPNADGTLKSVLFGAPKAAKPRRERFGVASLASALPPGTYRLEGDFGDADEAALAWLLSSYRFNRYREDEDAPTEQDAAPVLVAPDGVDPKRVQVFAESVALTQDLINTPANDMGPSALEAAVQDLAERHGASFDVIRGGALEAGFPLIHTVGRAAAEAPRLLDLRAGDPSHPLVTLVGKGVCFDTGGLNLKPGSSMGLMKKDMGGAATTIGLAEMILSLGLPVRLRLLIPAVENAVSAGAFRPGDIIRSRKGLTVEVNNTDAEGRLVLADAMALGAEEAPAIMVSMATLTGAARVALGPDIPPFYTDDDTLAGEISTASETVADPLWRMPFWEPYEAMIEPGIADLDNAPAGGFAGSITAALFLRRFAEGAGAYAHFDIYGWTPAAKPARPKGGACQGARALFHMLDQRFGA